MTKYKFFLVIFLLVTLFTAGIAGSSYAIPSEDQCDALPWLVACGGDGHPPNPDNSGGDTPPVGGGNSSVPEPSSFILLASALAGLAFFSRRKFRNS